MTSRGATLIMLAALLVSACTRGANAIAVASPSPLPTPSTIAWTSCGGGFQCGSIPVPLDYSGQTAGTITIAMIRKPATDPAKRIGSLLVNPGGPGDPAIDFLRQDVSAMSELNVYFDLVAFDPRGVGQSDAVHCLPPAQQDAYNAVDPVLDDPQEKAAFIQADKDYAAACEQQSGRILPFIDTASAARDMDLVRAALGDPKLTYLGLSYGTFLGQMYAHLFPTHVRALSLDGVVDPSISAEDLNRTQLISFEANLQAFLADCRARKTGASPCQYAKTGDPGTKLTALMQQLDAQPLQVGSRLLTRAIGLNGVLLALYDQSFWSYLDQGLTLADQGNGSVLMALSDTYYQRSSDGTYSSLEDANAAIDCVDRPVASDIATYDALGPVYSKISPLFGPAFQYSNLLCSYWPAKETGHVGPLTADGAPPILLVGGSNDPATPYVWAQSVHSQLAGSVLLTRQGNGHTSFDSSPCSHAAEDAYLINLTLPAEGTVCSS
ncbi:MAG: alpha/beta hydrolase [Candidatus Dormiibacterota bacterium]